MTYSDFNGELASTDSRPSSNRSVSESSDAAHLAEARESFRVEDERRQYSTAGQLHDVTITFGAPETREVKAGNDGPQPPPAPDGAPRPDQPVAPPAPDAVTPGPDQPTPPPAPDVTPQPKDPFIAIPHRMDVQLQNDPEMKDRVNSMLWSWLVASLTLDDAFTVGDTLGGERTQTKGNNADDGDGKPTPVPAPGLNQSKPPSRAALRAK